MIEVDLVARRHQATHERTERLYTIVFEGAQHVFEEARHLHETDENRHRLVEERTVVRRLHLFVLLLAIGDVHDRGDERR